MKYPAHTAWFGQGKLPLLRGDWNCSYICNTLDHIRSNCPLLSFGSQTAIGTLFNFGVRFGVTSGPQFYNQIG